MAVWTVVKYAVAFLLVVSGGLCFVAAANLNGELPQGDYRYEVTELNETEPPSQVTESTATKTPYPSERTFRVLQFSNLSAPAQTIFLKTLTNGGTYATDTHPDDFQLNSDTSRHNYVRYQNSTYQLDVHNIRLRQDSGQILFGITVAVGSGLTVLGGGALLWWNRTFLRKRSPF
ncbi:hypothetical protein [Salinibaculum rarum]|uniref:hypothetical protein n=1 Tax=Salinibaculum rarum TaxID=3058903 RepID=UPI00265E3513|nr:hypothetical protein [Salinibaculum sp. KK48]